MFNFGFNFTHDIRNKMIPGIILQSVQTLAAAADTLNKSLPVTTPPPSMSLLELIIKGGPVMVPLLLLSILMVYLTIERSIILSRASKTDTGSMMDSIKEFVMAGKIDAAIAYCKKEDSPVSRMIEKGIRRIGKPLPEIEEDIESVGKMELYKLEKNIAFVICVSGISGKIVQKTFVVDISSPYYKIFLDENNVLEILDISVCTFSFFATFNNTL